MLLGKVFQQPGESVDYDLDYSEFFMAGGDADTIFNITTTVVRTVSIDKSASSLVVISAFVGKVARLLVSGGITGEQYRVTTTMTGLIDFGRVIQDELIIALKEV